MSRYDPAKELYFSDPAQLQVMFRERVVIIELYVTYSAYGL